MGSIMSAPDVIRGVVRGGVIVFEAPYPLPDGTEVEFTVTRHVFTAEEQTEFEAWDKLGDEAWAMIEKWEKEEGQASGLPRIRITTDGHGTGAACSN
jgi:hypothetical protein